MKKFIAFILVICVSFSLFAGFEYRLDLLSLKPLHKEYMADKDGGSLSFNYLDIYRGFPDHVFQDGRTWEGWQWNPTRFDFDPNSRIMKNGHFAFQMKLGESLSLLRNTFSFDHWLSPVAFDFTFSGILDILMEGEVADMLAYDGAYFYGMTMSVGKYFSARVGFQHLCTHYGDGIVKAIPRTTPGTDRALGAAAPEGYIPRDDFSVTYKYVRMNGIVIGLSLQPIEYVRLYGEYNFVPVGIKSLRPVMFQPNWVDISKNGDKDYADSYGDRIISFGIELNYPIFPKLGKTTIAYDCHMYEEGKIVYKHDDGTYFTKDEPYKYDPDRPWIFDHGIVINQQFSRNFSLELGWHMGRSPLHAFWYMDGTQYWYLGCRINADPTVTIWNSAK